MDELIAISSPLYSEILTVIALLVISGFVLLIIRHYVSFRATPAYLLIPIFFALALPASIVLLVPIDLASILRHFNDKGSLAIWLPSRVILISWRILYWETFFLTWFILPILAEYVDAGYRDPKVRLIWSLKRNLTYHAIVFGSGFVAMIYFFVSSGISFIALKGLLVATAYFWSLFSAIYLMGHGLVSIPRRFFRGANLSARLKYLYTHANVVHEKMIDAIINLEDLEAEVAELARKKIDSAIRFHDWIEELAEEYHMPNLRPRYHNRVSNPEISVPRIITEQYLADLSRTLCRARHSQAQYINEWNKVVNSAAEIRETLDAYSTGRIEVVKPSPNASLWERLILLSPYTRFLYRYYVLPNLSRILGVFFSLASFFIIWSEIIKPINPFFSIIAITVYHPNREHGEIGLSGQIIAASWILYMCFAALTSLTEVKVWKGRALVWRNTHGESALWYSYQVAKLSVPLAFNFITFLDADIYKQTVFYNFLGKLINLTPLSSKFDLLWSTFIIVPFCATFFDLYGKINKCIGYGGLVIDEENSGDSTFGGSWTDGKILIERELQFSPSSINSVHNSTIRCRAIPNKVDDSIASSFSSFATEREHTSTAGPSSTPRSNPSPHRRTDQLPENSYESFWHRLKNTTETVQTPKWLQDIGHGIKVPKWMTSRNEESQTTNSRWLSGLRQDRRVHL